MNNPVPFDLLTAYFEEAFARKEKDFVLGVLVVFLALTGFCIFLMLQLFKHI